MSESSDTEWLTPQQVCDILKIAKYTLYKMRKAGIIHDTYPKGRPAPGMHGRFIVLIARSEVDRLIREGTIEKRRGLASDLT